MGVSIYRRASAVVPLLLSLLLAAGRLPAGEPSATATAEATVDFLGLRAVMPAGWQRGRPSSSMRLAQFTAASADASQSAETVFYYFGRGRGGTAEANIARWQSQFRAPDGAPPQPRIERAQVSGMALTRVELQGSYARGVGAGPGGAGKPGQTLIAAIVETPQGPVTIQLHGDTALVEQMAAGFDAMLQGIGPAAAH